MTKTLDNLEGNCPWLRLTLARKEHGMYIVCNLMYCFLYLYQNTTLVEQIETQPTGYFNLSNKQEGLNKRGGWKILR